MPQRARDWHAYHLIGDVMRSDEHALRRARTTRDSWPRVRERLAQRAGGAGARQPALGACASGAGARALVAPGGRGRGLRRRGRRAGRHALAPRRAAAADARRSSPAAGGAACVAARRRCRWHGCLDERRGDGPSDPQRELDRYLAAHRQYANGAALAVPGGVVRNVDRSAAPGR